MFNTDALRGFAALLIPLYEVVPPPPADLAKPPIDTAVEAGLIIQPLFDPPPLLIRAWGLIKCILNTRRAARVMFTADRRC